MTASIGSQVILINAKTRKPITRLQFFAAYPDPRHPIRRTWRSFSAMRANQREERTHLTAPWAHEAFAAIGFEIAPLNPIHKFI